MISRNLILTALRSSRSLFSCAIFSSFESDFEAGIVEEILGTGFDAAAPVSFVEDLKSCEGGTTAEIGLGGT